MFYPKDSLQWTLTGSSSHLMPLSKLSSGEQRPQHDDPLEGEEVYLCSTPKLHLGDSN